MTRGEKSVAPLMNLHSPDVGPEELAALQTVLASGWLGKGVETASFEDEFAQHLCVPRESIFTVPSCSEALFHAVRLLDLQPGDEVLLPTISFLAAGQAIRAAGAIPVLCDVDPRTLNATARTVAEAITPRTKAALLLHFGGLACHLDEIIPILRERGVVVIEDAACSPATQIGGRACGTLGDIGVWSFDSAKIMTMSEGGALYVADPEMRKRLAPRLRLGQTAAPGISSDQAARWWEFDVVTEGRKAQISDVAAAMGRVQLRRLPEMLERRRRVQTRYRELLGNMPWVVLPPQPRQGTEASPYLFWIQVDPARRDALAQHLRENGIYTAFYYHPLHRTTLFAQPGPFPGAECAAENTLCLPSHSRLDMASVGRVCELIAVFWK
ncbi:DegT/DnrJ/EryC1/StrS family aminotransferase [Humidesulfovibrio idahonensis]